MDKKKRSKIKELFEEDPDIKLGYLFGSQATGDTGPLSDYDFAVYIKGTNNLKLFEKKIQLQQALAGILGTDAVDVVLLNTTENPLLRYSAITEGVLLHEVEPYKVEVEPQIVHEYIDFYSHLRRHGLTRQNQQDVKSGKNRQ